jgi:hypothetical protein
METTLNQILSHKSRDLIRQKLSYISNALIFIEKG